MFRIIFVSICTIGLAFGANILILSGVPSPSHSIWLRPLATALAAQGHNITVVSPDIEKKPPKNLTYVHLETLYSKMYNSSMRDQMQFFDMADEGPLKMLTLLDEFSISMCKAAIRSTGFKHLMDYPKDFKYDLFMSDYMIGPCLASLLMYRFGSPPYIPVAPYNAIATSSPLIGSYSYSASIPNHSFDVPLKMSFWQRIQNFLYDSLEEIRKDTYLYPQTDAILRTVIPNAPSARDLQNNIKLLFINSNPLIQYKDPMMPNVIPVGGMQIQAPKPLPDDLNRIVSKAKNGFILFSLGSNARSDNLGPDRIRCVMTAMKAFPQYQFLWKFESDESKLPMPVPDNVFIRAWMPQNDLLAHPNIKLFMTHSGLLSTQEAIWNGVPIIGFPLFADQFRNINYCSSIGVAQRQSIQRCNAQELIKTIQEVTSNPSYSTKMKRLSQLVHDQPETPLERAVWWVNWVLRNPDVDVLQSSVMQMGWMQKYLIDVLLVLFIILSVIILLIVKALIKLVKRLNADTPKQKQQ